MHTVINGDKRYTYPNITAVRHILQITPKDHIAIVQNEDSMDIWILGDEGCLQELTDYYNQHSPWVNALQDAKFFERSSFFHSLV